MLDVLWRAVVVVLALAGAMVAAALTTIAYSAGRLFHDVAATKEAPMPDLATGALVPSVIYGADGSVIATLRSSQYRQPVSLAHVSPILIHAVLDTEDHSFWQHGGLDVEATARALLADVSAGAAVQGGSTIAQQLVKNIYLTDQKTLSRKVREGVLAERLEEKYTKSEILNAYLNTVYLGSGAYGVQAASKEYFNKDADELDVAEAALLAGLIQAPSAYDPITDPEGARIRRGEVLSRMVYYKTISLAQAAAANETPVPTVLHEAPGIAYTSYGFYVEQVVNELLDNPVLGATLQERETALFSGGLKIYTNEVPSLQADAQQVSVLDIPSSLEHVVAAFAMIDPRNGDVEAVVGGPNPGTDQFDDAIQGERQPGSGFKLFSLIGALESGYNVYDSILATSPCAIMFPGVPSQYGYNLSHPLNNDAGQPNGAVSLVEATAASINCAYLRLAHEVTLRKVVNVARSMGISDDTLNPDDPSLVIGTEAVRPIEMAAAYATVADGGIYHAPSFINRVVDHTGTVIYTGQQPGRRVFSAQVADEAIVALRATVQYGTGTAAALPNADVAGKTGTTENSVDAWFNGITPTLVSSVWIGDPNGEVPMYVDGSEVYGADYPTQIWHDVMHYALRDTPYSAFPLPDPSLMPPVQYIDSPSLEVDDLISHGGGGTGPATCTASGAVYQCAPPTTAAPVPTTYATVPSTYATVPTTYATVPTTAATTTTEAPTAAVSTTVVPTTVVPTNAVLTTAVPTTAVAGTAATVSTTALVPPSAVTTVGTTTVTTAPGAATTAATEFPGQGATNGGSAGAGGQYRGGQYQGGQYQGGQYQGGGQSSGNSGQHQEIGP